MNAATVNRFVKSASLIASVAIVTVGASWINSLASPAHHMQVVTLPRVVVTAQRQTIVELPRVVVTGHRSLNDQTVNSDTEVAERAANKTANRG